MRNRDYIKVEEDKVFSRNCKLFGYNFTFVLRYKGDTRNQELSDRNFKDEYEFGIFYKKTKVIKDSPSDTDLSVRERFSVLVPSRILGVKLLWCKFWVTWDKGALILGE